MLWGEDGDGVPWLGLSLAGKDPDPPAPGNRRLWSPFPFILGPGKHPRGGEEEGGGRTTRTVSEPKRENESERKDNIPRSQQNQKEHSRTPNIPEHRTETGLERCSGAK